MRTQGKPFQRATRQLNRLGLSYVEYWQWVRRPRKSWYGFGKRVIFDPLRFRLFSKLSKIVLFWVDGNGKDQIERTRILERLGKKPKRVQTRILFFFER